MIGEVNPTLRRRKVATELRRLREEAGLNGVRVAGSLRWSTSKLSRMETGQVAPSADDVAKLLTLYHTDGERGELLLQLAENDAPKGWWEGYSDVLPEVLREYIGLEHGASSIRSWNANVLPGLLQTRAYATELAKINQRLDPAPPSRIERRAHARLLRQQVLTREPPPSCTVVLDEAVLRRRFGDGDAAMMREQLRHLLKVGELPNISIRVLLLEHAHPLDFSGFVLLGFPSLPVLGPISADIAVSEEYQAVALVEAEERVYRYSLLFDLLCQAALDEESSRDCIASLGGL
ncbi:helix-turn-helix domain-containing protein [Nonomuraea purpurea]|uniref:Helix-turn-helix domain-containing protein n=1 Tax=Nonomuraea purpurea TaxID=1849276 RepID=A0ABV8GFT1_9ACTN